MELSALGHMMIFSRSSLFAILGCLLIWRSVEGSPTREASPQAQLRPFSESNRLRGAENSPANVTVLGALGQKSSGMPCQCDLNQNTWLPCRRTVPKCVFIDLGAANGNTLQDFVKDKYGPVANCPSGQWEAILVEANPRFNAPLKQMEVTYPGSVHANVATAAYMCQAQTTFYLDTVSHEQNYWGSSMSANHDDTKASGHQAVTVPTVNIVKLIYENSIPGDYVILKMDIEGAEWDVLPCLAKSNDANLVDRLFVEVHPQSWGNAGTTQAALDSAMTALRAKGVDIPGSYHSQTL